MKTKVSFITLLLVIACLSTTVLSLRHKSRKRASKMALPTKPLYRYYNGRDHFYTTDTTEIGTTTEGEVGNYNYECEGYVGYVYTSQVSGSAPLYRYYRPGDHLYTMDASEIGTITEGEIGAHNYEYEKIAGYMYKTKVTNSVALYRYFNGRDHFYTTDSSEIGTTTVGEVGNWKYQCEGIVGYILPTPIPKSGNIEYTNVCLKFTYTYGNTYYLQYSSKGTWGSKCDANSKWDLIPQGSNKYCIYNRQNEVYLSIGQTYGNYGSGLGSSTCGDIEKWTMESDGYYVTFTANSASKIPGDLIPAIGGSSGTSNLLQVVTYTTKEYEIC